MVIFYANKILNSGGEFTIENVPKLWRDKVDKYLKDMDLTGEKSEG